MRWCAGGSAPARSIGRSQIIRRNGLLAILIPSLLPPPAPFKIFVLLAGVAGIPPGRFTAAIVIGRGVRYFGEGLLALWYGEQAIDFIRDNGEVVGIGLVALLVVAAAGYWVWRKTRAKTGQSTILKRP